MSAEAVGPEGADAEDLSAWPALVDLLSATSLLFLTFLCVMIYVSVVQRGQTETTRQQLLSTLIGASQKGRLFRVDSSDKQFVRVVLNERATFPTSGAHTWAALQDSGKVALGKIAQVLNADSIRTNYREVRVIGHADQDRYPEGGDFTNWELSAARAAVVARFLINKADVDPCAISATGYGPYYPVTFDRKRMEDNRRIEIEILPKLKGDSTTAHASCSPQGDGSRQQVRGLR
jgi:chemotaxis protein MotB